MISKPLHVPPHMNLVFATSSPDVMPPGEETDRRFFTVDLVKLANAQQHAEHLRKHADYIVAKQRASGIRVRLCSTGCFAMYNAAGNFIGRTAPAGSLASIPPAALKTTAVRMAYSEELAAACRAADLDVERTGAVSAETITTIRSLLSVVGAA